MSEAGASKKQKIEITLTKEACSRFFVNKSPDFSDEGKDKEKKDEKILEKVKADLQASLTIISEQYVPKKEKHNPEIYTGVGGIVLMYLRLYFQDNDKKHLKAGKEYLKRMEDLYPEEEGVSFLIGCGGLYALQAVFAHLEEKSPSEYIEGLKKLRFKAFEAKESELLYGKSGYLYAVLFVNAHLGKETIPLSAVSDVIDRIFAEGEKEGRKHRGTPLMWKWGRDPYIGAAHGVIGILHTLLYFPLSKFQMAAVWGTLEYLIRDPKGEVRFPSGNWAAQDGEASEKRNDYLVHWCHGAVGMVFLLTRAAQLSKEGLAPETSELQADQLLKEAEDTADLIWKRGLLKKGLGLCHGISGCSYCFLNLYKHTGNPKYLYRAQVFANFVIENWKQLTKSGEMSTPDHPFSLMEGLAGMICFYSDLIGNPKQATFPGYEI